MSVSGLCSHTLKDDCESTKNESENDGGASGKLREISLKVQLKTESENRFSFWGGGVLSHIGARVFVITVTIDSQTNLSRKHYAYFCHGEAPKFIEL